MGICGCNIVQQGQTTDTDLLLHGDREKQEQERLDFLKAVTATSGDRELSNEEVEGSRSTSACSQHEGQNSDDDDTAVSTPIMPLGVIAPLSFAPDASDPLWLSVAPGTSSGGTTTPTPADENAISSASQVQRIRTLTAGSMDMSALKKRIEDNYGLHLQSMNAAVSDEINLSELPTADDINTAALPNLDGNLSTDSEMNSDADEKELEERQRNMLRAKSHWSEVQLKELENEYAEQIEMLRSVSTKIEVHGIAEDAADVDAADEFADTHDIDVDNVNEDDPGADDPGADDADADDADAESTSGSDEDEAPPPQVFRLKSSNKWSHADLDKQRDQMKKELLHLASSQMSLSVGMHPGP